MKINLKCFAGLAEEHTCDYRHPMSVETNTGATPEEVMEAVGVPNEDVKIVFVNGRIREADRPLQDQDNLTLVPATGGM